MGLEMGGEFWAYAGFVLFVLIALVFDLLVLHRDGHEVTTREAAVTTAIWVGLAMVFAAGIFVVRGTSAGTQFLTGYLIEESLSIDNIFVFVLLFKFFAVPPGAQHRVLFYGVLGAQVFRAIFIFAGVALINRFEFTIFIFGAFLVFSGLRLVKTEGIAVDAESNRTLRLMRRFVPMTNQYDGPKLFTHVERPGGGMKRMATPLLAVLVVIEVTDLVFAVDSIPAVLAISTDQFIVFTSNIFAILGLRSLYFLLAGVVNKFHYLRIGLAATLTFVGLKMLASHWVHMPTWLSLLVIATLIGGSIAYSLLRPLPDEVLPAPSEEVTAAPRG
jgi:tellurite resistance protein TerC